MAPTSSQSPPFLTISSATALASANVGTSLPIELKETLMDSGRARDSWAFGLSPITATLPGVPATAFLIVREIPEWIPPHRPPSEETAR